MRRLLIYLIIGFCLVNNSHANPVESGEILVVIPRDAAPYKQLVGSLEEHLKQNNLHPESQVRLRVVSLEPLHSSAQQVASLQANQLVIAFGAQATEFSLSLKQNVRIISSFISRSAIKSIYESGDESGARPRLIGAIYLEQPISRIVSLVRLVHPGAKKIGTVYGPVSIQRQNELLNNAKKYQLDVIEAVLSEKDNPLKKLHPVIKASDAVVILPDKSSFNRRVARWIITLSIKNKVPVIGFSRKYTQAGALVSIYSRVDQIGEQTAELAGQWLHAGTPANVQYVYPKYFEISVNARIANSLGIYVEGASELEKQLMKLEGNVETGLINVETGLIKAKQPNRSPGRL